MFIAWGADLTFLYNDAYADILGNKHPAALGEPFQEVWWDIWSDIKPLIDRALEGEATWSENLLLTMERKGYREETWWTFSYSPIRDEAGVIAGMFCSCMETTPQVLAERRSQAERDQLFEMSRDLFAVATFDGFLKTVNPAWSRALARADDELLTRPFAEIIHPDDLAVTADVIAKLTAGEPVHHFHVRLLKKDGEAIAFAWSAVPAAPELGSFYTVGRDITEELRREEMLRQSQKMEAVGQLTGGLAHDFNNLLAGISGSLELISMRLAQGRTAEVEKYATAARGAATRAAALTHRLLAFSRRQTLAPKPTNLKQLVSSMEDLIARTIGPQIHLETINAAGLWTSLIDPNQLENAILNLCINARDAMPDGGKITIETGNRWFDARTAKERGLDPGQYISLCVSDTGTGMTAEVQAKAFDPFFTTKPIGVGTGLGLSMIYGFARQSGGAVTIYSEAGMGSMVCIYLPRYCGDAEIIEKSDEFGAPPRGEGETVLVIDDEPTVRMLVSEVLADLGYAAIEAEDGASGLKVLSSPDRIDLLVTDVGLPNGLNGRQVADAARLLRPELKVLFITGYAEIAVLDHGHLERGMHVMTKPFSMDELATRIRDLIESDLPPSEWSKISVILDHEGVGKWARSTSRKRLSASCVKLRSYWRRAGRQRMRAGGSRLPSRPIIAGARNMVV
ncbi:PAS domain-containing sensor histidine kinase [Novosphingobium sp. JCM 18896]|uniref:hybrid sensor histidine kinase/response regulator n=1 Tax=Novosphingobium sp. JCM 18896 TaxID=2989731 RepID=UPI0022222853|nr:PAS domain-containing sensor histidine kinase [Novosphingobium sp. JCM 18896]MCW1432404.1 PAS domain-containing protein [Novosphingobium sp. JCM 18896]